MSFRAWPRLFRIGVLQTSALAAFLAVIGTLAATAQGCSSTSEATPADAGPDTAPCVVAPFVDGDDACTAPLAPGSDRKCTFTYEGKKREYLVYAPANFNACAPTAMVVDAHGATETDVQHAGLERFGLWPEGLGSGWRIVADKEGFVVVTPQGIDNVWKDSDVGFLAAVEKQVAATMVVDAKKVYLTGISNGGYITYASACGAGDDVFTGYAPISAFLEGTTCNTSHRAPLIAFHSKTDESVDYASGTAAYAAWIKANHCTGGPATTATYGGPDGDTSALCLASGPGLAPPWTLAPCKSISSVTTCDTYDSCDNGKATFCTVAADKQLIGGHILYVNDTKLSLAAVTWQYFKQFAATP